MLALAPDNKTLLGEGKLTVIDNQIDPTTGTIRLKAEFPNDDNKLWPGQFVNARVLVNTVKGGLVVPASVIQRGPENAYAYVIKPDQTVEMRPVKVGQIDQGEALVEDGLTPDETVVVDGQYKLQPGSKVRLGDAPGGGGPAANPAGPAESPVAAASSAARSPERARRSRKLRFRARPRALLSRPAKSPKKCLRGSSARVR